MEIVWTGTKAEYEAQRKQGLSLSEKPVLDVLPKEKPEATGAPKLSEREEERQFRWALEKLDANPNDRALAENLLGWAQRTLTGDRLAVLVETAQGYLAGSKLRKKRRGP